MKKRLSLLLAVLMAAGSLLPTAVSAIEDDETIIVDENDENSITVDELETYKRQVQAIREEAKEFTPFSKETREMVDEFNTKTSELEVGIDNAIEAQKSGGFVAGNIGKMYDLASIPDRITLAVKLCQVIRFATTNFRYKVREVQVKVAAYVIKGLVLAVNPLNTVDEMRNHIMEWDALQSELMTYPDLTPEDPANLYVREDLAKKLRKARALYMHDLKEAPKYVLDELNTVIRQVTRVRLSLRATVQEVYDASDLLDAAVGKAYAQVQNDHRANRYEKQDLKAHLKLAKQARRKGNMNPDLANAISEGNKIVHQLRASSRKVNELIETIRMILELGPRK